MKKKVVGVMLAAAMLAATGAPVAAAEVSGDTGIVTEQDAYALVQEAEENEGLVQQNGIGVASADISNLVVDTKNVNPGGTFTVGCTVNNATQVFFYYDYVQADGTHASYQTDLEDITCNGNYWTAKVHVPADVPAGVWRLDTIQMFDGNDESSYVWNAAVNPWMDDAPDLSSADVSVGGAAITTPAAPEAAPTAPAAAPEASAAPETSQAAAADLYIYSLDNNGCTIGMTTNIADSKEYRWLYYDTAAGTWGVAQDWTADNEWLNWKPEKYGDYVIQGEVRSTADNSKSATQSTSISYHPNIKGKCQMPYEGGGYLIGVESYDNPDNNYSYELLVLDCTKLASGDPNPWIYTSGQQKVSGNAFWTVWQPQYGYYWTLFRVYDANGNMIDQDCYSFQNAY